MRHKIFTILPAISFVVVILGCSGYYMVKDPASGNVYYTTKIKNERIGVVKFEDKKTQAIVILQNSEVKKISKKEFKNAIEVKE